MTEPRDVDVDEFDLDLPDGRVLHAYATGGGDRAVLWQHGTPNTGPPPTPLLVAGPGVRWFSFDRPGYGGSSPRPGRTLADVATDAVVLADHLGLERFGVAGHSSGAAHALALAAAQPGRIDAVLAVSALAPRGTLSQEAWFAGMGPAGTATLRAAVAGRAAAEAHQAAGGGGIDFTDADWAVLEGEWGWLGAVAAAGQAAGPGPLVDDDLALVGDWGVDLGAVRASVVLLHGEADLIAPHAHARRLGELVPGARLRTVAGGGHLSVLTGAAPALRSLLDPGAP